MFHEIVTHVSDGHFMVSLLVAVAVIASIITVAMPFLNSDAFQRRMKGVASERERIRARERAAAKAPGTKLRQQPKVYMKSIVDRFALSAWLNTEGAKAKLASAGYRGPQAEIAFLFFRAVAPVAFLAFSTFYLFVNDGFGFPIFVNVGIILAAVYVGIKTPELFISNTISKRRASMRMAFPDALDLMLICVESGMSIEHAFRKVGQEIGSQSIPLAEEFALATAELAYLPERRLAYLNLATRTGLDAVKQIATVLIQAEKYGTPLGQALRITAQESRDMRMMEAEKKAASLPPKLTVPMIVFFLPVLMVVVMSPAVLQIIAHNM
jgi:tight adherence protein C